MGSRQSTWEMVSTHTVPGGEKLGKQAYHVCAVHPEEICDAYTS